MTTEQERLLKAKQKLLNMNKKVLHAQNISKKRTPKKPDLDPLSPPPPKPSNKGSTPSTYLFELTESMIVDGFTEEEVSNYVKLVEAESKCTDLELDQHEISVNSEIKKINRTIKRIKDPKGPNETPANEKNHAGDDSNNADDAKAKQVNNSKQKNTKQPGYAEIQKARGVANQMEKEREKEKELQRSPEQIKKSYVSPTPKKSKLPARKKDSPAIQATAAGAKFFADLANDDDDDMPF